MRTWSRSELPVPKLWDIVAFYGIWRGSVRFRWTTQSSVASPRNYLNPGLLDIFLSSFLLSSIPLSHQTRTTNVLLTTRQRSTVAHGLLFQHQSWTKDVPTSHFIRCQLEARLSTLQIKRRQTKYQTRRHRETGRKTADKSHTSRLINNNQTLADTASVCPTHASGQVVASTPCPPS